MTSRDIPSEIKRLVRQRDRFGCVVCGLPIYDYEHFVPYAERKQHELENIYLACDRHHRAKGKVLSNSFIERCRAKPFNATHGRATENLHFSDGDFAIRMGNNNLTVSKNRKASALTVHGQSLLDFRISEDGVLVLSLHLFDSTDESLLSIVDNEIDVSTVKNWDITWEGTTIVVRRAPGKISLRVSYDLNARLVWVESAELWCQGEMIAVAPAVVSVRGNLIQECEGFDSDILICVGEPPENASCANVVC